MHSVKSETVWVVWTWNYEHSSLVHAGKSSIHPHKFYVEALSPATWLPELRALHLVRQKLLRQPPTVNLFG